MALAFVQNAIARDHHQRVRHGQLHDVFRDRVDGHEAALLAVFGEALRSQALAGGGPLQVAEADPALPLLPALVEDRRPQVGHARGVRVGLGRDIEPARACPLDHRQAQRSLAQSHAGDVDHVYAGAGGRGVGDHFLQGVDHAGLQRAAVAHMDVERNLALRRQPEQLQHLGARFVRQVGDAKSDPERAFVQPAANPRQHVGELFRRSGALHRFIARQQLAGVMPHRDARRQLAAGGAEVDQRPAFALCVPRGDGVGAHLHFKRRRHAVARLETIVFGRLPVRMQIDESRRDDQSRGVDRRPAPERRRGNGGDLPAANTNVPHRVEIARRVQHTPVGDHQVVRLPIHRKCHQYKDCSASHHRNCIPHCGACGICRADPWSARDAPVPLPGRSCQRAATVRERYPHTTCRNAPLRSMPLSFPIIGNAAEFVGRTPGPRGTPSSRSSPAESSPCSRRGPTRASAADGGVRPTINADVRRWEN